MLHAVTTAAVEHAADVQCSADERTAPRAPYRACDPAQFAGYRVVDAARLRPCPSARITGPPKPTRVKTADATTDACRLPSPRGVLPVGPTPLLRHGTPIVLESGGVTDGATKLRPFT